MKLKCLDGCELVRLMMMNGAYAVNTNAVSRAGGGSAAERLVERCREVLSNRDADI